VLLWVQLACVLVLLIAKATLTFEQLNRILAAMWILHPWKVSALKCTVERGLQTTTDNKPL
jgi:hypothetical protein